MGLKPITIDEISSLGELPATETVRTAILQSRLCIAVFDSKARQFGTIYEISTALGLAKQLIVMVDKEFDGFPSIYAKEITYITYDHHEPEAVSSYLVSRIFELDKAEGLEYIRNAINEGSTREAVARMWLKTEIALISYSIRTGIQREIHVKDPLSLTELARDEAISQEVLHGIHDLKRDRNRVVHTDFLPDKNAALNYFRCLDMLLEQLGHENRIAD